MSKRLKSIISLENFLIFSTALFCSLLILIEALDIFFNSIHSNAFSPDSWALLDISKNFFYDFYKVTYIRQFEYNTDYSTSFPPLFPFLISLFNMTFKTGIYAGYIMNFFIFVLTIFLASTLFKRLTGFFIPGFIIGVILITNSGYLYELTGARTIPLSVLFFCILCLVITEEKISIIRKSILSGVISGLLVLNRFDFLIGGLLLGIIFFLLKRTGFKALLVYYLSFSIIISPWIFYSYIHFGRIFVSDNQRTVFLAINNFTLDYFPKGINDLPTLFNNPAYWIVYRGIFKGVLTFIFYLKAILINPYINLLIWINVFIVSLSCVSLFKKNKKKNDVIKMISGKNLHILLVIVLVQLFTISLTGFFEERYISIAIVYFYILLFTVTTFIGKSIFTKAMVNLLLVTIVLITSLSNLTNVNSITQAFDSIQNRKFLNSENIKSNEEYLKISEILKQDKKNPRFLVHGKGIHSLNAARFSVTTNITVLEPPGNVNEYILTKQIEEFKITHINTSCAYWLDTVRSQFIVNETGIKFIYSIKGIKAGRKKIPENIRFDLKYRDCTDKL